MITARSITKRYGDIRALDGLSFTVEKGTVFGLLGPNGAGKSTAMSICTGLVRADSGDVDIGGAGSPSQPAARRLLGLAPQQIALYLQMSARENLMFLCGIYGVSGARRRADELLDLVGLLPRGKDRLQGFSGGMQRRLNLAAALVHDPPVLLLDEPTAGVDPQSRANILEVVQRLAREGRTVVYTTHYMEEAQKLCDWVAIVDHGKLLAQGTVPDLMAKHGGQALVVVQTESGEERLFTENPLREIE
ncbi:MAG: ABC transporter ATP-binding protein, partial [Phycisphaerae bacterium]|nr:ABC transporter ATP-binding protein [Phycisphaerae bacterium]